MKRSSFLRLFAAAGAFMTGAISASAGVVGRRRVGGGIRVAQGKDRYDEPTHLFEGDVFYTKIGTKDTGGDWYAFESTRLKKGGPALHIHHDQDEWFYVLSGQFLIKVGEETFTALPGDCVFVPRMVPHAFAKVNEEKEEARMLVMYQPAGKMESYFKAVGQGVLKNMSEGEVKKYKLEHGVEVVGPALTFLKQ